LAIGGLGAVLDLFPPFFDMCVTSSQPRSARDVVPTLPDADSRPGYLAFGCQATRSVVKLNPLRSVNRVSSGAGRLLHTETQNPDRTVMYSATGQHRICYTRDGQRVWQLASARRSSESL
jgi:hypothetical protein